MHGYTLDISGCLSPVWGALHNVLETVLLYPGLLHMLCVWERLNYASHIRQNTARVENLLYVQPVPVVLA